MKIHLEKAIFVNRAPFDKIEFDFNENEIAVLTAINGKGKTTVLSHIVDAFYEMARPYFTNEFENKENKFYRVSSNIHNLNQDLPSFVYLRFKIDDGFIDYVDIRNNCTSEEYNEAIKLVGKIDFSQLSSYLKTNNSIKKVSSNFNKQTADLLFGNNVLTFFPSYRYEMPGYLNDPYKINLDFKKQSGFSGYLSNPIEVISGLPQLANWILDIVLDLRNANDILVQLIYQNLSFIISKTLIGKITGNLFFAVGPRNYGDTRIQILENKVDGTRKQIYPTIFNLSSGESSILCLFGELLRQADNIKNNIPLSEISGVVLIDEIDKHLHIKLQKEVLPELFILFPNVQFIISSHSPFLSMGLAEKMSERSKIIDLDNFGISKDPTTNDLYKEVYNMMITENDRFMNLYQEVSSQLDSTKVLQIITEGKNTEHIEKAIEILNPELINQIKIIKGSEDKAGSQQMINAFNLISKTDHINKFLFIWDCDCVGLVEKINETDNAYKFCFAQNIENSKIPKGIENLYNEKLFTQDVYVTEKLKIEYGGEKTETKFNKNKFLEKIKSETSVNSFQNYSPLIIKIKQIINLNGN